MRANSRPGTGHSQDVNNHDATDFSFLLSTLHASVSQIHLSTTSMSRRNIQQTPPRAFSPLFGEEEMRDMPETPAPQRARVNNLNKQVDKLVKERHNLTVCSPMQHTLTRLLQCSDLRMF